MCTAGYSDNNDGMGQNYSCESGVFNGSALICTANDCSSNVPSGTGYGSQCDGLVTDATCVQECESGFADGINNEFDQTYSCEAGVFAGTVLVCQGTVMVETGLFFDGVSETTFTEEDQLLAMEAMTSTTGVDVERVWILRFYSASSSSSTSSTEAIMVEFSITVVASSTTSAADLAASLVDILADDTFGADYISAAGDLGFVIEAVEVVDIVNAAEEACSADVANSNATSGAYGSLDEQVTIVCDDTYMSADGPSFVTTCEGVTGASAFANLLQCRVTYQVTFYFDAFPESDFSSASFANATEALVLYMGHYGGVDVNVTDYQVSELSSSSSLVESVSVTIAFNREDDGERFLVQIQTGVFVGQTILGQAIESTTAGLLNVGLISAAPLALPGVFALAIIFLVNQL